MNSLALDRGSKRIGLAWMDSTNNTPLPLGFLPNDGSTFFTLAAIVMKYNISTIIYGYPEGNTAIMKKIDNFITNLKLCCPDTVTYLPIDEHYSSAQASDVTGDFDHKHISQDTVAAMIMLERWKAQEI